MTLIELYFGFEGQNIVVQVLCICDLDYCIYGEVGCTRIQGYLCFLLLWAIV